MPRKKIEKQSEDVQNLEEPVEEILEKTPILPEKKLKKIGRPKKQKPENKKLSDEKFEEKIIEMAKKGLTSEKIGEALRQEGIHPMEHKKKISEILRKNDLYIDPELKNIGEKLERLTIHHQKFKQDKKAMRERERVFSQLRKVKKYLKISE